VTGQEGEHPRGRGFGNVGQRNMGWGQGDARIPVSQGARDVVRRDVKKAHAEVVRAVQSYALGGLALQGKEPRRPWVLRI
jgi:hypothetical protein